MPLLPLIKSTAHYYEIFKQDDVWLPAVHHLVGLHKLNGTPKRATRGSNIIYRIGNVWLKLISPNTAQDMIYELAGLESLESEKDIQIPKVFYTGELEDWPYVVLSHIEGIRIGEVYENLPAEEQVNLAKQMAQVTKNLQAVTPHPTVVARGNWNEFIEGRFKGFHEHHKNKKLTGPWLDNMPKFMARFTVDEFKTDKPLFLHSDLTGDHFLLTNSNGTQKITGVIDLADCRTAHREYDVPATAVFLLKKNREALRTYAKEMGFKDLSGRFSEKILAWTLLHYYSNLEVYFSKEMIADPSGNFEALARLVFPLD